MIRRFRNMKIRTQSAIVILCAIIAAFAFFELLWLNKWKFCEAAEDLDLFYTQISDDRFKETLAKEALNYNIPESEDDEEAVEALQPFLDLANEYTSIYIYGEEDSLYRTGIHYGYQKLPLLFQYRLPAYRRPGRICDGLHAGIC